jgi:hypothetical protein
VIGWPACASPLADDRRGSGPSRSAPCFVDARRGPAWTNAGTSREERAPKHRADNGFRAVPTHPELEMALTPAEVASPLARRPYDLRHAAVSTWLNAGLTATQVAE